MLLLLVATYFAGSAYFIDLTVGQIVFAVCAGGVAFVLLGERHVLVIDREAGTVVRRRGILLTFPCMSMPLGEVTHLSLVEFTPVRKNEDDEGTRYRVLANGSVKHVLANVGDPWHGRRIGELASKALQVPLDNRVYHTKSRRSPDELDTPLVERWRKAGKSHERPAPPADSTIRIEESADEVRMSLPAQTSGRWIVIGLIAFFGVMATIFFVVTPSWGDRIFLYVFFGGSVLFLIIGGLSLSGRSQIVFRGQRVSTRQGSSPLGGTMTIAEIEEMIAARDGIVLVGDRTALWLHWPRSKPDREFMKAYVAYELAKRGSLPEFLIDRSY